jgi:hypothetical protein
MASEMRRAAKALVETRVETFESLHSLAASKPRLERGLAALGSPRALTFHGAWSERVGRAIYEATFAPAPTTRRFLNLLSLVLVLLVTASVWAFLSTPKGSPLRFLLPFLALFALVAIPFVVNAAASNREAEEARIRHAVRVALAENQSPSPR